MPRKPRRNFHSYLSGSRAFIALTALSALFALGETLSFAEERVQRDVEAQKEFRNLNFFSEGGGMHLSPGLLPSESASTHEQEKYPLLYGPFTAVEKWRMTDKWGMNFIDGKPEGIFDVRYKGMRVGVLGCVACHSGKAAGQFIVGLGNKNIDTYAIGSSAYLFEKIWEKTTPPGNKTDDYNAVEQSALRFAKTLGSKKYGNLTQGMVPTSMIRMWFYTQAKQPIPEFFPRSAVKVPAFWGYSEKRKVGQFSDGFGNGDHPGWAAAVELAANQTPEAVRGYLPKLEAAENLLGEFLPPKYPFFIDIKRAEKGKATFDQTCAKCHGTYENDSAGLPVYKAPKYIPWEVVKTDRDRLDGSTPEFMELVKNNPLNDVLQQKTSSTGYFAARLHGIWSRFPYLHNGSVPSIAMLLKPASQRPKAFSLDRAGEHERFDKRTLGLTLPKKGSPAADILYNQGSLGKRDVYFVDRIGHSNEGHEFYTDLPSSDKEELIEYLKTL